MSQLLLSKTTSNLLNRTFILQTKPATNTALPFINHYAHHLHPLPIIKLSPQIPTQIRTYYQRKTLTESYPKRISDNVSKMYARRMLFLAALSASNMASKTRMESSFIAKPKEWSTVDLEKQRREFGESISSLGSTKLSRVWAAGKKEKIQCLVSCLLFYHLFIIHFSIISFSFFHDELIINITTTIIIIPKILFEMNLIVSLLS